MTEWEACMAREAAEFAAVEALDEPLLQEELAREERKRTMGQYYYVINLDKKQYLHPHRFGDGLKLMEFACSGEGTMTGLAILLADGNGRGMGDVHSNHSVIGSWAGDRIIISGDYADNLPGEEYNLYNLASVEYEEISAQVIEAMCDDENLREALDTKLSRF